jgi:hypothetical protein
MTNTRFSGARPWIWTEGGGLRVAAVRAGVNPATCKDGRFDHVVKLSA